MLIGIALGVLFALLFQTELLENLIKGETFTNKYQLILQVISSKMELSTALPTSTVYSLPEEWKECSVRYG